jgi:cell division protein FtsW
LLPVSFPLQGAPLPHTSLALEHSRRRPRRPFHLDTVTVALVLALLLIGLVMVASSSMAVAAATGDPFYFLERQLLAAALGVACAAVLLLVPSTWLARASVPLAVLALGALAGALLTAPVNGSRRWLQLAAFGFQPSEAARPLILMFLASHAARHRERLREGLPALRLPLLVLGGACALLAAEPDLGDTFVLGICGLLVLFLAGARVRDLVRVGALAAFALTLLACTSRYGLARLRAFLDPWADPYHGGFQLTQSLIAIGRGEWFGVGLGNGVQKLFYLPEAHTDFLFASLAEELGLAGVCATVLLFLALTGRSLVIARRAVAAGLTFQGLLAACFGLWLGLQAFINIGVNMGVLPTKGLTLPFMSYGRSSLIVTLAGVGVLMRVYHEARAAVQGAPRG